MTTATANLEDRDLRQRAIIPPERLAETKATVIGVGAIGRQVCLQLAAIGVPSLQLIDFDTVEAVNLAPQGFMEDDLGRPKVEATAELCQHINKQLEVHEENGRFKRSMELGDAIFCCVDSIDTRKMIWETAGERAPFFVDGRMSAEVLRVISSYDMRSREHYPSTLFTAEEAYQGECTSKSTIYCANIAAGMMIAQFTQWLRKIPGEVDISLNLLTAELSVIT